MTPFLLVLSSPSGGGKTTIARLLRQARRDVGYSVSATTRAPREGEREGADYHFVTRSEFERRVAAGEFAEYAPYGGNLYGTLRSELARIFAGGQHAVLDIEVQGARQLRAMYPEAVHVFILPPSAAVLASRLSGRRTEEPGVIARRLELAAAELAAVAEYDYVVPNDDLASAVGQVGAILDAESRRVGRQLELAGRVARLRADVLAEAAKFSNSAAGAATEA